MVQSVKKDAGRAGSKPAPRGDTKSAALPPAIEIGRMGRPSQYKPFYCELVLDLGAEGKSRTQIAAALGVARNTLANWSRRHPDFLSALKHAKDLELAWWEDLGQANFMRPGFNAKTYIFQMKNRFRRDYGSARKVPGENG